MHYEVSGRGVNHFKGRTGWFWGCCFSLWCGIVNLCSGWWDWIGIVWGGGCMEVIYPLAPFCCLLYSKVVHCLVVLVFSYCQYYLLWKAKAVLFSALIYHLSTRAFYALHTGVYILPPCGPSSGYQIILCVPCFSPLRFPFQKNGWLLQR